MQIQRLEQDHGAFYVPAFAVTVDGEDLVRDLYLAVSAVTVDLKEKAAGHFSFTVASAFDWEEREFVATKQAERIDLLELFAFGAKVEVRLGYGDASNLPVLLSGVITEITTAFTAGSTPELTISGLDDLYPLTVGQSSDHWEDKPDSTAVAAVAAKHGIPADVEPTKPKKQRIEQSNESDMAFIEKLAARNGATFYARDGRLRFGPRRNTQAEVVELGWGSGLLSFSPEVNLARQITEVRVHGWTVDRGKAVVGRARRGDESGRDPRAKSGADRIETALSAAPVLNLRAAVRTQEEADARAKAVLEERAQEFLTGTGESIGLPEIVPDTNVTLTGLGRAFSKTYYVSEATHTLDGGGYRTSFTVQETTI